MSAEDLSVSSFTEGPHRHFTMHPPPPEPPTVMNTPPPSYLHSQHKNCLYSTLPLPLKPQETIHILFNNINALEIENETALAKGIDNYLKHDPTILGLIETKCNFQLQERTTKPLRRMVQACLQTPAKIKMVTGSCHNEHTAQNLKMPGGVCQFILNTILSLHKASGSDDLG
jgi:hypothetical protein